MRPIPNMRATMSESIDGGVAACEVPAGKERKVNE